jgi:hypothetical protein
MTQAQMRATAVHEAGHAVAEKVLDIPVCAVSIAPDENSKERLIYMECVYNAFDRVNGWTDPWADSAPKDWKLVEGWLLVSACGRAADRPRCGRAFGTSNRDWNQERRNIYALGYEGEEVRLKQRLVDRQANWLVELHWRQVGAVAEALLDRERLSGAELREIVETSYGDKQREPLA